MNGSWKDILPFDEIHLILSIVTNLVPTQHIPYSLGTRLWCKYLGVATIDYKPIFNYICAQFKFK